jgi:hypothetical protein
MEQWATNAGGKHALPCVQWLELPCRYATDVLQPPARVMTRAAIIDVHHDVHWRPLMDGTLHILKCTKTKRASSGFCSVGLLSVYLTPSQC